MTKGLRNCRVLTVFLSAVIALAVGTTVYAASPPPSSPAMEAGNIGQQQLRNANQHAADFSGQGYIQGQDIPPETAGATVPASLQHTRFSITSIDVTGATALGPADFAPLLKPHLNRPNTLADIYALAHAIAEKYRADGYPFTEVRVPGQHLVGGRLTLHVVEFSVAAVDFVFDDRPVPTPASLQSAVARILASQPVRSGTLENAVAAAKGMAEYRVATMRVQRLRTDKLKLTLILTRPGESGIAIQPPFGGPAVAAAAAQQRIPLRAIQVTGSTVFKPADFAPLYAKLLGHDVSLAELHAVAQRIAAHYTAAGYFGTSVDVPPQLVRHGVVTIEVTELSTERVQVNMNGKPLPSDDLLYRAANAVTADKPMTTAAIEHQLYVLNHIPGVLVQSVIPPTTDDPNAQLYLKRKPFTFTTAMDNRGTVVSGPLELGAMVQEDGQLGLNEEIQLLGLKSLPVNQLTYGGLQIILPVTSTGLVATALISHTSAYPGGYLGPTAIAALGDMLSLGLNYPIIATARTSTLLTMGFDMFNNTSSVFGGQITTSDERSRDVNFGFLTTVSDSIGGTTTITGTYTQNLDGLGARPDSNQINTRPGLKLNAAKFGLLVSRVQLLPDGFKLSLGMRAQRALAPLPSAQIMTFGGVDFGRAYDSGIITGDSGIAGKIQLSRLIQLGNPIVPVIDPYIYYDNGETFSATKTPGVSSSASAASTGIGARIVTGFGFGGSVELDFPLTHGATLTPGETDNKSPRIFFLLFAQF